MKTSSSPIRTAAIPIALIALLAVRCSGNGQGNNGSGSMDQRGSAVETGGTADDDMGNGTSSMAPNGTNGTTTSTLTPEQERTAVTANMKGLRAELMSDLDSVRTRLNDGTMTAAQQKTDKAAAADLAQGLERVDRALAAMDSTTDATWASMREVQMKEVTDVRAWLDHYRSDASASAH
jgi:hypothetical protein